MKIEKRRFHRLRVDLDSKIRIGRIMKEIKVNMNNISEGGFSGEVDSENMDIVALLKNNLVYHVIFKLEGMDKELQLQARKVWDKLFLGDSDDKHRMNMGFSFDSKSEIGVLKKYLKKHNS